MEQTHFLEPKAEYKYVRDDGIGHIRREKNYFLPIFLGLFQILFVVLYGIFGSLENYQTYDATLFNQKFSTFLSLHIIIFFGFGFLMVFLKKYGYSSIALNFLICSYTLQWALLIRWAFEQTLESTFSNWTIIISLKNLISAEYCVAAVLISFCAVAGKTSISQLITMATFEVIFQCFNEYIGTYYLMAHDAGNAIFTHVFGVFFGMSASLIITYEKIESKKEKSSYNSNLLALLGTLVLCICWPQFNAATAQNEGQAIAIINTLFALSASCVSTFIFSSLISKSKLNMVHIRNATLAGGVAIASIADLPIQPYFALIIGLFAGAISTICYEYLTPALRKIYLNDTCGVTSLFGIPGIISGILSGVYAAILSEINFDNDRFYQVYPARVYLINSTELTNLTQKYPMYANGGLGRSALAQSGYQILSLVHTICIAVLFGLITGIIMKISIPGITSDEEIRQNVMFDDEAHWIVPEEFALQLSQVQTEEEHQFIEESSIVRVVKDSGSDRPQQKTYRR